jgi:hypothetical protein
MADKHTTIVPQDFGGDPVELIGWFLWRISKQCSADANKIRKLINATYLDGCSLAYGACKFAQSLFVQPEPAQLKIFTLNQIYLNTSAKLMQTLFGFNFIFFG